MTTRSVPLLILGLLGALSSFRDELPRGLDADATTGVESPLAPQNKNNPDAAKSCGKCHTDQFKEWSGRMHSKAWTDEIYQGVIKKKKRAKSCYGCHIPVRVLARATMKKQRKPKTRKVDRHEGVTCVSCHEHEGAIHGPFGAKTKAHKSVKDEMFANATELCMSCHSTKIDVVLPLGKQFKAAGMKAKGKSCVGCHMPEVERHMAIDPKTGKPDGPKRKGRSHIQLGPRDPEFCLKAFKLSVKKGGGTLTFTIGNEAGHGVPGLRSREFHFHVHQLDQTGKQLATKKIVVHGGENPLAAAEKRETALNLADGATSVEIVIDHVFMEKKVATLPKQKLGLK